MGSSAVGVNNGDITVYDPGVITDTTPSRFRRSRPAPTASSAACSGRRPDRRAGHDHELARRSSPGRRPSPVVEIPRGYVPCSYVAPSTGLYNVVFYGPAGDGGSLDGGVAADVNLTSRRLQRQRKAHPSRRGTSPSARPTRARRTSTAGSSPTPSLRSRRGNGLPINQTIYVVTTDGFRYQTDTRGLDPNGYLFFGSRTGFLDADGVTPLNHDVLGTSPAAAR